MHVLEDSMARGAAYVAAGHFTLADVVIALSIHRWRITPIEHVDVPSLDRYMERVRQRGSLVARRIFALTTYASAAPAFRSFARRTWRLSAALMPRMRSW